VNATNADCALMLIDYRKEMFEAMRLAGFERFVGSLSPTN
jgi:hypothetical protein